MSWKYPQDILHRKLRYLTTLASPDGINISMDKWLELLKDIQLEISYDVIYRLLEEIYLMINAGFDWSDFDFPPIPEDFPPEDIIEPPLEEGTKAYYDVTYYDTSYYDPPDIQFRDLERYAWSNRYRISEKETLAYKKMSTSMKQLLRSRREGLEKAGVADYFLDVVEDVLAMVESRILRGMYVGFSIVGLSKVAERHQEPDPFKARVATRHPEDWKTIYLTESVIAWESLVGWSRVNYSRVGSWYMIMNKALSDEAVKRINEFWLRSGLVEVGQLSVYGGIGYTTYGTPTYGGYAPQIVKTLYPRTFMLQRVDQYHYKGGAEQLKMQFNIKRIRPILDKYGVIANFRSAYYSFTHEVYYLAYDSHKLYKLWRKLVTQEDIIQKYVMLGCQEEILRTLATMVKP